MAEKRWTGPADIAWCPEHGLHGARETCFECGKAVEQIRMVPLGEMSQKQRVEYRVVGERNGRTIVLQPLVEPGAGPEFRDLYEARGSYTNVRIQTRTVIETPWSDYAEGRGEG